MLRGCVRPVPGVPDGVRHADSACAYTFVFVRPIHGICGKHSVFVNFARQLERLPLNTVTYVRKYVR